VGLEFDILVSHAFMSDDTYRKLHIPYIRPCCENSLYAPHQEFSVGVELCPVNMNAKGNQTLGTVGAPQEKISYIGKTTYEIWATTQTFRTCFLVEKLLS